MSIDEQGVKGRILKDIDIFKNNIEKLPTITDKMEFKVVELSKMYAKDSKSYLEKNDLCTSFSCISYAHGLLDAIRTLNGVSEYV